MSIDSIENENASYGGTYYDRESDKVRISLAGKMNFTERERRGRNGLSFPRRWVVVYIVVIIPRR